MADETAVQDQQDTQAEDTAQDTGDATGTNGGNTEQTFTQADVERIVAERIDRERKKAEKERERAEAEAEAKRLESQQEYQQLAEQRQQRVTELEPLAEKAERYEAALNAHLETQREGLPAHILTLLDRMDVADQLEYIAANRDSLKPAQEPLNGIPNTGRGNGQKPTVDDIKNKYLKQAGIQV